MFVAYLVFFSGVDKCLQSCDATCERWAVCLCFLPSGLFVFVWHQCRRNIVDKLFFFAPNHSFIQMVVWKISWILIHKLSNLSLIQSWEGECEPAVPNHCATEIIRSATRSYLISLNWFELYHLLNRPKYLCSRFIVTGRTITGKCITTAEDVINLCIHVLPFKQNNSFVSNYTGPDFTLSKYTLSVNCDVALLYLSIEWMHKGHTPRFL